MSIRQTLVAALIAGAGFASANAATLTADGSWSSFDVDSFSSLSGGVEWIDNTSGAPLSFDFTIADGQHRLLTVVDAGFAGDTFTVYSGGSLLGSTSSVPVASYDPLAVGITDFDTALADPAFSRGQFLLGAGSYQVTGSLAQSLLLDGQPLNATLGGIRLSVAAIPEPDSLALLLAGLGLMAVVARRRAR
jgi:hypothetical protein